MIESVPYFYLPQNHIDRELNNGSRIKEIIVNFRRILKLTFKLLKNGTSPRTQKVVARAYEDVYSVSNETWLEENRNRRLEVVYNRKHLPVDGFFLRNVRKRNQGHLFMCRVPSLAAVMGICFHRGRPAAFILRPAPWKN